MIADALESLVSADFVGEEKNITSQGRVVYLYQLMEDGKILAEEMKNKYPEIYRKVKTLIDKCWDYIRLDPEILSWMAKVHYLLKSKGKPMSIEEVEETGKRIGWELSEANVKAAIKLLEALGYVKHL